MDSFKYQQIKKNQNLTASARNLTMGRGWIFQQDSDPKTNIKIKKQKTNIKIKKQKWVTEHKTMHLQWPS